MAREELGAGQDEGDHAVQARGAQQRGHEAGACERALQGRQDQRADHAHGRRLGGGGDAGVDGAQHRADEQQHRDQVAGLLQLLHERDARIGGRHGAGVPDGPPGDIAHEQQRQQEAGENAGDEQLGDGDVGRHAVDDHDDGRRNQQAQGTGAGQRAEDLVLRIAAPRQFGDGHLAHRGAGGGRRAGNRGEDGAADDVGVQQPAGQPVQPRREALEQVLGQAGAEQDLAHPQEQRQGGQRPARRGAPDRDGHGVAGRPAGEDFHADPGRAGQGEANPDSATQQREDRDDQQGDDQDFIHGFAAILRSPAHGRAARVHRAGR
uniref:Uncharacterized protein orfA n=1 Tax=Bordetella pertussis TaxID=520 RepID=Q79AL3_BORPT|nr:hypothetical protein [Bordetella pertussis]